MPKYRIQRKQAKLYVNSEISLNNLWLKEKLEKDKLIPSLTYKEYESLDDSQKRFIDSRFSELLSYAISEWVIVFDNREKEDKDKEIDCELCGEKNIKYLSQIKNSKTQKTLLVGSSCITEYSQMKDSLGKTLYQIRKESNSDTSKILKNEEILENRIPNILKNIERFNKIIRESGLIIRKDINSKYEKISKDINSKYKKYLKLKKMSEEKILEIKNINEEILNFFEIFKKYSNECESDIFGLNKKVSAWCYAMGDYTLLNKLETNGYITKESLHLIKEPNFLKRIIIQLKDLIENNDIKLNENNIGNTFKISLNDNIYFEVNSSDFIEDYKEYLYNKEDIIIDKNALIKEAKISDKLSLNNSLKLIEKNVIPKIKYQLRFSDIDINEISFYNNFEKNFYCLDFIKFINKFKTSVLNNHFAKEDIENVEKHILTYSTKYCYEDYKEHLKNYGINIKDI